MGWKLRKTRRNLFDRRIRLTQTSTLADKRGQRKVGARMYTQDDAVNVCGFIKNTPEGSLRKMLVSGPLTDQHFRLLVKLAKGGPEADFTDAFLNESMGKLKLNGKELALKETFWPICKSKMEALGLIVAVKAA